MTDFWRRTETKDGNRSRRSHLCGVEESSIGYLDLRELGRVVFHGAHYLVTELLFIVVPQQIFTLKREQSKKDILLPEYWDVFSLSWLHNQNAASRWALNWAHPVRNNSSHQGQVKVRRKTSHTFLLSGLGFQDYEFGSNDKMNEKSYHFSRWKKRSGGENIFFKDKSQDLKISQDFTSQMLGLNR